MAVIFNNSCVALAAGRAIAVPCAADLSAADVAKLGATLTPIGAEKAGNAAGTIPAWDGGITKPVAGYQPGGTHPDPYASDKPLFTIDAKNADQYKDSVAPGAIAMMKKYPDYKMVVYPTRRSAAFPQCHYNETKQCAASAKLAPGGNGVVGCSGGIPFPIPKDGNEAIWNLELRYSGDTFAMNWAQAAVTRTGDYALVKFEYEYDFSYGNCSNPASQREANKKLNYLHSTTAPSRLAAYARHRVWVIGWPLKPGTSHIYAKRVFYIDEDSWSIMATDKYDGRGELWRYAELHSENWYDVPMYFGPVEVHNDLQSGRYIAMGLRSEETKIYEPIKRTAGDYTPSNLRGVGNR